MFVVSDRPSRTATKIARFVLLVDGVPGLRDVLPAGAASATEAILRGSGAVPRRHIDAMRKPSARRFYELSERLFGRGQLAWFAVRKRWMADRVEAAIRAGATQLLVVGAGFDPLAAMTARARPDVLCVEIDAPATAERKRAGVDGAGLASANHCVVAADLSRRALADALGETPWRSDARSIVVAEGVLMYLERSEVEAFLAAVRAACGEESRLAFSTMDADERGRATMPVLNAAVRFALRLAGEPLRWGIRPPEVEAFLAARAYRVLEHPSTEELRARYFAPLGLTAEPLLPYEHLVLAETVA
ncbi:MAG TPA: SAM-dependent methyltransferase [Sandaracinaceae bacterium]